LQGLLAVIADRCQRVKWKGSEEFTSSCPNHNAHAHGDRNKSFSARATHDRVLLKCHAGCSIDDICRALGLEEKELFFDQPKHGANGETPRPAVSNLREMPGPKIVATYDYTDEAGKLLFQSVRFEPKDFRQRHPGANGGGWIWNLKDVRLVPFHLPQILDPENKTILILEGEKDCLAAHNATGLCSTTNPMGAGKWHKEYNEFFRGKAVIIFPDNDAPGIQHGEEVARQLYGTAASVAICKLPVKDFSEWTVDGAEMALYIATKQVPWTPQNAAREIFATWQQVLDAKPLSFAIDGFLPLDSATAISGLAGQGKTLVLLSIVKALLSGEKLWGLFPVLEPIERVIYLIPESTLPPFKHRLGLFRMLDYVRTDRLLIRTLSQGPMVELADSRLVEMVKGSALVLDTAVRFMQGEENKSLDNQKGLATSIFNLLGSGARLVLFAHHAPKAFYQAEEIHLENVMRGTGDLGAMVASAWGVKQIDPATNSIRVENVKSRDAQAPAAFEIQGRPSIDELGDFTVRTQPGECEKLMGVNEQRRASREDNLEHAREWWLADSNITAKALIEKFAEKGVSIGRRVAFDYLKKLRKEGGSA
jgi:hypothetical protein